MEIPGSEVVTISSLISSHPISPLPSSFLTGGSSIQRPHHRPCYEHRCSQNSHSGEPTGMDYGPMVQSPDTKCMACVIWSLVQLDGDKT